MKKVFMVVGMLLLLSLLVACGPKCVETDNGNDPFVKGSLNGFLGGENEGVPTFVEDSCYNETYLNEYLCMSDKGHYAMKKIECANGCVDGACA